MSKSNSLGEIVERLSRIPDLSGLGDVIEAIRATYDVDHVYYYAISLGLDAPSQSAATGGGLVRDQGIWRRDGRSIGALSYTPDWIHRYFEARYDAIDPVTASAALSFAPVDWAELDWGAAPRRRFRGEAGEHGVGNQGYTVPVRGPGGQFALFTVNKACRPADWARLLCDWRSDFMLLAHYTHQQALRLAGVAPKSAPSLSPRERDALSLLAAGHARARAAERLGISENTLRVYVDSARHKLGALNIPHAIALAAHRGVITPQ